MVDICKYLRGIQVKEGTFDLWLQNIELEPKDENDVLIITADIIELLNI